MKKIIALLMIAFSMHSFAQDNILPSEQAFYLTYNESDSDDVLIGFRIASGYKMYRDQFSVDMGAKIKYLSKGVIENDPFFGDVDLIKNSAILKIDTSSVHGNSFNLYFQGCKSDEFCYPLLMENIKFKS